MSCTAVLGHRVPGFGVFRGMPRFGVFRGMPRLGVLRGMAGFGALRGMAGLGALRGMARFAVLHRLPLVSRRTAVLGGGVSSHGRLDARLWDRMCRRWRLGRERRDLGARLRLVVRVRVPVLLPFHHLRRRM
jgi:hypothetical protein